MQTPLNKKVLLTHKKNGIVAFLVPALAEASEVRLKLKVDGLVSWRHSFVRKRGAFFIDLFKKGFFQNGAISLDGFLHLTLEDKEYHPSFRTVIQMDGDIICKINQNILKEKNIQELLRGYVQVRRQFLESFEAALRIRIMRIIASIGIPVSLLVFIDYFFKYIAKLLFE